MLRLCAIGPGDLHLDAIARDEDARQRWLREASEPALVAAGICPRCRSQGCDECAQTGRVVVCEECGAWMAPGAEQVVPMCVDRPNGPTVTICGKCAESVEPDPNFAIAAQIPK